MRKCDEHSAFLYIPINSATQSNFHPNSTPCEISRIATQISTQISTQIFTQIFTLIFTQISTQISTLLSHPIVAPNYRTLFDTQYQHPIAAPISLVFQWVCSGLVLVFAGGCCTQVSSGLLTPYSVVDFGTLFGSRFLYPIFIPKCYTLLLQWFFQWVSAPLFQSKTTRFRVQSIFPVGCAPPYLRTLCFTRLPHPFTAPGYAPYLPHPFTAPYCSTLIPHPIRYPMSAPYCSTLFTSFPVGLQWFSSGFGSGLSHPILQ